jgi:hypothetical protein
MTPKEYEDRYAEALDVVRRKHPDNTVGEPEYSPAGYRFVHIDGFPCNDHIVFTMAWDEETAQEIIGQKPR